MILQNVSMYSMSNRVSHSRTA